MIAVAGRSNDVHTAMVDRNTDGRLLALGMRLNSQKLLYLENEVAANPGLIDVYRYVGRSSWSGKYPYHCPSMPIGIRRAMCDTMRAFALNDQYGWLDVLRASVYFLPFFRWVAPHNIDPDNRRPGRPFCTQAVSFAIRKAHRPLLNSRPDRLMLPGDAVESPSLVYLFTLVPADETPAPTGASKHGIEHYYEGA
jgi:hypothetical protein